MTDPRIGGNGEPRRENGTTRVFTIEEFMHLSAAELKEVKKEQLPIIRPVDFPSEIGNQPSFDASTVEGKKRLKFCKEKLNLTPSAARTTYAEIENSYKSVGFFPKLTSQEKEALLSDSQRQWLQLIEDYKRKVIEFLKLHAKKDLDKVGANELKKRLLALTETEAGAEQIEEEVNRAYLEAESEFLKTGEMGPTKEIDELLRLNLGTHVTMDYRRINLTEVLLAFGFNRELTLWHWRIAKIMDGILTCNKKFGICDGLSPTQIPEKIYKPIKEGKTTEKTLDVTVTDPDNPESKPETIKASLADFAKFMDIYETNRALGSSKIPWKKLIYNFFKEDRTLETTVYDRDEKDPKKTIARKIDLKNKIALDDLRDLRGEEGIEKYISAIKKNQSGFQVLGNFRYKAEKHRENAGHSYYVISGDEGYWLPLSGLMAHEITASDLRKQTKIGPDAHPHEISHISEAAGIAVYFEYNQLQVDRSDITDPNRHNNTTQRMYKFAVGLGADEERQITMSGKKKVVHLGGKDTSGSQIISGVKATYDETRKKLGLNPLTNAEASDVYITDVLAPFFLNNRNDWLMCLALSYDVQGSIRGGTNKRIAIVNSKQLPEWEDFELKLVGKDVLKSEANGMVGDNEIKTLTFKSYSLFEEYMKKRYENQDIDQKIDMVYALREMTSKVEGKDVKEDFGTIKQLLQLVLGGEYDAIIDKYIDTNVAPDSLVVKTAIGSDKGEKRDKLFTEVLLDAFNITNQFNQQRLDELLTQIVPYDTQEDMERDNAINSLIDSLARIEKDKRTSLSSKKRK